MDLGISASVPYYNQTFLMDWETYRDVPLSTLLADIIQRSDMTDQRRRFADLIRPPTFNLYIAGQSPPLMTAIVSSVLVPGELVLVLTHAEARELFPLPPTQDAMSVSLPSQADMLLPPLFRRQAEGPRTSQIAETMSSLMDIVRQPDGATGAGAPAGVSLLLSMLSASHGFAQQTTPLQRINARYEHLLAEPRGGTPEEAGDEEIVEQGVMRTLVGNDPVSTRGLTADPIRTPQQQLANVMQTLNFMTGMLGTGAPAQVATSSGVRKVINMETFNRVCPILTQEEITALTTTPAQEGPVTDEESDMVGGAQDAGLGACSVCLSLLVDRSAEPGELRKMPNCTHKFHAECLAQWLTNNAISCPVCREPAVTETRDYGYLGYGSHEDEYTPADTVGTESSLPEWIPTFPARPTLGRVSRRR